MRVRDPMVRGPGPVGLGMLIVAAFATIALGGPSAATAVHASARGRASEIFFEKTRHPVGKSFGGQLWAVRPDGSHVRRVRRGLPTGPLSRVTAILSQDQRRILCVCRKGEIDSIRLDGSHLRRIGRQPRNTVVEEFVLGPSGQLLWERDDFRIVTQRANGAGRHFVRNVMPSEQIALSPGGNRVAFVGGGPRRDTLAVANLDGTGRPRTIFRDLPGRFVADPSWSSDGATLAFREGFEPKKGAGGGYESAIYVVGSHGSGLRKVTDRVQGSPIFSPDGSQLAFDEYTDGGFGLFTIGVEGGEPGRIHEVVCQFKNCPYIPPVVIGWAPARRGSR